MAGFSKLEDLSVGWDLESWGKEDWQSIAGISRDAFVALEDEISGRSNVAVATTKVLAATAQATAIRLFKSEQSRLKNFDVGQFYWLGRDNLQHRQSVKLQHAGFLDHQVLLQAAFSQLTCLKIEMSPLAKATEAYDDVQKVDTALRILLGSDKITELLFCFDSYAAVDFSSPEIAEPGITWIYEHIFSSITVASKPSHLRVIDLDEILVEQSVAAVAELIKDHAVMLQHLSINACMTLQVSVTESRGTWKDVLRAAMTCRHLRSVLLYVVLPRLNPSVDANNFYFGGNKVVTTLADLVEDVTSPSENLGWVK